MTDVEIAVADATVVMQQDEVGHRFVVWMAIACIRHFDPVFAKRLRRIQLGREPICTTYEDVAKRLRASDQKYKFQGRWVIVDHVKTISHLYGLAIGESMLARFFRTYEKYRRMKSPSQLESDGRLP